MLPAGCYTKVVFKDTGCGIAQDDLLKVYDPYFTTRDSGTGLGLSTTHAIIKKHGGYIDIVSEVGKGTNVTILLPSAAEEPADSGIAASPSCKTESGGLILIMDDDKMIRDVTEEVLSDAGFETVSCCRGEEALRLYKEYRDRGNPFTLAILDLSVPDGMGGERRLSSSSALIRRLASWQPAVTPTTRRSRITAHSDSAGRSPSHTTAKSLIAAVRKVIDQDCSGVKAALPAPLLSA